MNKAIEFIKSSINKKPFSKDITVYGWQNEFKHTLVSSVSMYLFEDFDVIENLAPLTNENREGIKKPKFYVTVHDTGDADPTHTAKFWSETVKNEYWEQGKYACSYQYVVGNDGTYHNIPDDEIAWHAVVLVWENAIPARREARHIFSRSERTSGDSITSLR